MEQTLADTAGRAQSAQMESLFLSALPDIERVAKYIARRHRLSASEAEDFCSEVNLAIIENGYSILSSFQGRSSMRTYLTTVIQRLFLDYRRKAWGKWRPSAEAQRRGPLALRLEILLYRDGMNLEEALETMRTNFACEESREALAELAHNLPPRINRRPISDENDEVATVPASELTSPEITLEGLRTSTRVQVAIESAMEALAPEDRLVLRMRFESEISVADIARTLHLDQKRLYRRIDDLLFGFRKSLEDQGLGWAEVVKMIERGQCHLCLPSRDGENQPGRPSPSEVQV